MRGLECSYNYCFLNINEIETFMKGWMGGQFNL
jgi:hypothetical protein